MNFEHYRDDSGNVWVRRLVAPQDAMRWAGVPSRFWAVIGELQKTSAVEFVERLLAGEGFMLVLLGGTGCGKSTAAAWALSKRPGLWVHAPDLARPDIAGVDEYGVARPTLDDKMRAARLLVLDDVGLEHSPSKFAASRITSTLEHREANLRPTVVTTNLLPADLKREYGERIASRVNADPLGFRHIQDGDMRAAR